MIVYTFFIYENVYFTFQGVFIVIWFRNLGLGSGCGFWLLKIYF